MMHWCTLFPSFRQTHAILAIDFPCFGRSSGPSGQANLWRSSDSDLIHRLLSSLSCPPSSVDALAQCMGAGALLRAIAADPTPFSGKIVTHNATIGAWPSSLDARVASSGLRILAYHEVDPDHMREAVCYKNLKRLALSHPESAALVDNALDRGNALEMSSVAVEGLSRTGCVSYKDPRPHVLERIRRFVHSQPPARKNKNFELASIVGADGNKTCSDPKSRFQVYARVRPLLHEEAAGSLTRKSSTTISAKNVAFDFASTFHGSAPVTAVIDPLLSAFLSGSSSGVLFCYGQTGSGKTFTVDQLVRHVSTLPRQLAASYVQIYHESFFDLFDGNSKLSSSSAVPTSLAILSSDLPAAVDRANALRNTESTRMNAASSRSHSLLTLTSPANPAVTLTIVDLAGSERVKRSGARGDRLAEACAINSSLSGLVRVLHSVIDPAAKHTPARDCALTYALRDVFQCPRTRVAMVACVSPDGESDGETLCTLRFAAGCTWVGAEKKKRRRSPGKRVGRERLEALEATYREVEGRFGAGAGNIVTSGGVSVRGWEAGSGRDVDVVLLHYYGGAAIREGAYGTWDVAEVGERLRAAGVNARVLAPDFPGHGGSSALETQSAKPERSAFNQGGGGVATVLEVLDETGCGERTVVVGFDWGGGVAVAAAEAHAERVKGVVAWNAAYRQEAGEAVGGGQRWLGDVPYRRAVWTDSVWITKAKSDKVCEKLGLKEGVRKSKGGGCMEALVEVAQAVAVPRVPYRLR
jgi:pimeloyl-ACP methyl ester carboxylesterase